MNNFQLFYFENFFLLNLFLCYLFDLKFLIVFYTLFFNTFYWDPMMFVTKKLFLSLLTESIVIWIVFWIGNYFFDNKSTFLISSSVWLTIISLFFISLFLYSIDYMTFHDWITSQPFDCLPVIPFVVWINLVFNSNPMIN